MQPELRKVDRVPRLRDRAMFESHRCAAAVCHRATERSIHLARQ